MTGNYLLIKEKVNELKNLLENCNNNDFTAVLKENDCEGFAVFFDTKMLEGLDTRGSWVYLLGSNNFRVHIALSVIRTLDKDKQHIVFQILNDTISENEWREDFKEFLKYIQNPVNHTQSLQDLYRKGIFSQSLAKYILQHPSLTEIILNTIKGSPLANSFPK